MSYGCRVPPSLSMGAIAALRSPEMMRGGVALGCCVDQTSDSDASCGYETYVARQR